MAVDIDSQRLIWQIVEMLCVCTLSLQRGLDFHIFEREESEDHEMHDIKVVANQHKWLGQFPVSFEEITDKEIHEGIIGILSLVPREKLTPFERLNEREISDADKAVALRIMKLDPRDRPAATELLQDSWFSETSERTVRWLVFER